MNAALKQLAAVIAEAVVGDWIAEYDRQQGKKHTSRKRATKRKSKKSP